MRVDFEIPMNGMNQFKFTKTDTIGAADAIDDAAYLQKCFVDTGLVDVLASCSDTRRILVGRTGVGKTALLQRVADSPGQVITIEPDNLALSYISNSTILRFLSGLGVKLDIFYKLLWRHVFTVEILKRRFEAVDGTPQAPRELTAWIKGLFKDKKHQGAISYLEGWGSSFWQETDYRIKELTTKLETELKGSIGASLPHFKLEAGGQHKVTEEEKQEVLHRAQEVVNRVQIKELSEVIDALDRILDDPQERFYIIIDRLDEQWVEDQLRYHLIRALIETARDFRKVRHCKIIIALRQDLLERVFKLTRDAGFQEEKYESLYLPVSWSKEQLTAVLDRRIDQLVRSRYTRKTVSHRELLPDTVRGLAAIDWLLQRTMMRPRDVILFFNACIEQAADRPTINEKLLSQAEGEYSRNRLRSIADEWAADYPNLMAFTGLLKQRPAVFSLEDVIDGECEEFILNFLITDPPKRDFLHGLASQRLDRIISTPDFRRQVVAVFYKIGLVGLKLEHFEGTSWAYSGKRSVSVAEIIDGIRISIHPCFWRALGIKPV
jgi:hypothetical protein